MEVMIRKSLTAPNIRRMEQLLKEEDTDSEPDLADHSDHSDLSSVSSVRSDESCSCHCKCKIHNKRRRLNTKKKRPDRPVTNTRRSSFSERESSNFHVKTGISTSVSLSLRLGN